MSYKNIRLETDQDGIALITVDRPEKLNALNRETMGELDDAFTRARNDAAIRGLIITGAGEKAFRLHSAACAASPAIASTRAGSPARNETSTLLNAMPIPSPVAFNIASLRVHKLKNAAGR